MTQKTLTKAIMDVGLKMPGESAGDFLKQMKALTIDDRKWFADRFKIEYDIEITAAVAA